MPNLKERGGAAVRRQEINFFSNAIAPAVTVEGDALFKEE